MKTFERLGRGVLLGRCALRRLFHGPALKLAKLPAEISRIIVVPTGKLGDVVCATPVLLAIRAKLPKAQIIVAGNSKLHRAVLADSGLADEYLDLQNQKGAVGRAKKCQADAAIVTGPSYKLVATLYLAGVPLVVAPTVVGGFSPAETRLYRVLKRFIKTFPYEIKAYAPRERLKSLEPIGIFSDDTKKHLGFSAAANEKANELLFRNQIDPKKDFVVALSPTAGNKIKEWPEERFAEVADHLIAKEGAKVIIMGGPTDKEKVRKTIDFMKNKSRALEITDLNIDELKALMSKISLFIAVDTGPIYIAEAFSVPTVDIIGPVDENGQPPKGFIHRNVVPPGRDKAELSVMNARSYNVAEAQRQVLSIGVTDVLAVTSALIRDLRALKQK